MSVGGRVVDDDFDKLMNHESNLSGKNSIIELLVLVSRFWFS